MLFKNPMWHRFGAYAERSRNYVRGLAKPATLLVMLGMAPCIAIASGPQHVSDSVSDSAVDQTAVVPDWADVAQRVEIRRDNFGIPHIRGEDEQAAFFGFGYAQAEDHISEIAYALLRARGEASKYFGKDEIENDFAMLRFDNLSEGERALSRITPEFREVVLAYAAGLSRYATENAEDLPTWVNAAGPFKAADVLALIRARSVFTILSPRLTEKLEHKYGEQLATSATRPETDGPGSNAFALAGSRTKNGRPILLASPHLKWSSLYWEAQITVPGSINFFGNTLAGYPVLWAGFNDSLGWANTVNHADLDDIYTLNIDPADQDSYVFEGQSIKLKPRNITVMVRQDDGSLVEKRRVYWDSDLGPVLFRTPAHAFAVRSARLDAPLHFEGFYQLAHAKNLTQFNEVFEKHPVFSCNFIYADQEGNILYLWQAMLPKRIDDGTDYSLDVPGGSAKYVWKSLHSFKEMPKLLNPAHGVVQNANNPPWWAAPEDWIDPSEFPSYYEHGSLALRPQLALDLLEQKRKYSIQDVVDLTFNTRMLLAERILPDLLPALRDAARSNEELEAALKVLEGWDGHVAADSRGAVLFKRFWDTYSKALPQPYSVPWNKDEPTTTPRGLADAELAIRFLKDAVRWTRTNHGSESIAWGNVHRLRSRAHDLPGDGADGSYGTFHVMRYADAGDGKKVVGLVDDQLPLVGFGSNWIMLVEFGESVKAWSVLASGQSSDLDSAHSDDQLELFQSHKLRPVWFTEQEIEANLERTYRP